MGQRYGATLWGDTMGRCYGVMLWGDATGRHYGVTLWGDVMGQRYGAMLWGDAMGRHYGAALRPYGAARPSGDGAVALRAPAGFGTYPGRRRSGAQPPSVPFPCPLCRRDVELGERGLAGLFRNPTLERVVERFRSGIEAGAAVKCQACKAPRAEATKGCAECKASFCNECFKLCHPWGTQKAQHEPTPPSLTFRPKVRRYGEPYGAGGCYGDGGVCRPSLISYPKVRPYREISMGFGGCYGAGGVCGPTLSPHCPASPSGPRYGQKGALR